MTKPMEHEEPGEGFHRKMAAKGDILGALAALRADIAATAMRLETKIEQARSDTIKWVVGVAVAQVATLVAILRLLPGEHV